MKSITFFEQTKEIVGANTLCIRLANYIAENFDNIKIFYIGHKEYEAKHLINLDKITYIDYEVGKRPSFDEDTVLITFILNLFDVNIELDLSDRVKLLFWSIFPFDTAFLFPFSNNYIYKISSEPKRINKFLKSVYLGDYHKVRDAYKFMYENDTLAFMDSLNLEATNKYMDYEPKSDINYLPIPLAPKDHTINSQLIDNKIINIGWLGRLVEFKIHSLINIVKNADLYADKYNKKIKIHIIGSGKDKKLLDKCPPNDNVELVFLNTISGDELDTYILNNVDIMFAMGTSCIESSKLHIPSVLMDASGKEIPLDYKFKWIFESKNYCLGEDVTNMKVKNSNSFEEIINQVYSQQDGKEQIGHQCYDYFKKNHSIDVITQMLLDIAFKSNVTISDLRKLNLYKAKFQAIKQFKRKVLKLNN